METDINTLKLVKERAAMAVNPLSAILLPVGFMVIVTGLVPLSITLLSRLVMMIFLYCIGLAVTFAIQKYYSKRIGSVVPEEDQLTYFIRNSGYLVFIFFTLNIYASLFEDYDAWKYVGLAFGLLGFIVFLVLSILFLVKVTRNWLKKEPAHTDKLFDNNGVILLYFVSTWVVFETMDFAAHFRFIPILWSLFGPGLFFLGAWLVNTKRNIRYAVVAVILLILSIFIGVFFIGTMATPPVFVPAFMNLGFLLDLTAFRVHWIILGVVVVSLGLIEHKKLLNLFPKTTNE
jgi:hypothetical protein